MFETFVIYSPLLIPAIILLIVGSIYFLDLFPVLITEYTKLIDSSLGLFIKSAIFWLPFALAYIFWKVWIQYVRAEYFFGLKYILLEIKLPQDVLKSPLAMETFLMSLYQTGSESTWIDRSIKGQTRAEFSLEIVSVEGVVKFYIRAQKKFKGLIEPGLYAQYPNIEIHEASDYTKSVHFDRKDMDLYITDYVLTQPDAYPIKTYVDYGIDKESVEEEYKIDPINTILEFMGSIGANQQCWLQIMIKAHKKEQIKQGKYWWQSEIIDHWKEIGKEEIEKIRKAGLTKDDPTAKFPNPTKGQQERIAAIERSASKLAFDAGIRCLYIGKNGFFNKDNIGPVRGLLRAYGSEHLNGFKPKHKLGDFDYPWQDFRDIRQNSIKKHGLESAKRRCYFYPPYNETQVLVLNVEELASIFHLPGRVATTPTLSRIPSKKSQAPANLPI